MKSIGRGAGAEDPWVPTGHDTREMDWSTSAASNPALPTSSLTTAKRKSTLSQRKSEWNYKFSNARKLSVHLRYGNP